ncbi:MAG TPA: hypothetical protein DCQ98_15520, partial [Planctomycetaceae bacterium]|nr:hypothetical protein [Planctomycetaceae bacterium]
ASHSRRVQPRESDSGAVQRRVMTIDLGELGRGGGSGSTNERQGGGTAMIGTRGESSGDAFGSR